MACQRRHTTPQSEDDESVGLSQAPSDHELEQNDFERNGFDEEAESDASSEGHVELLEPTEEPQENNPIHVKAPPKGEELRDIKDATDLFRSTSFKLQVSLLFASGYTVMLKFVGQD